MIFLVLLRIITTLLSSIHLVQLIPENRNHNHNNGWNILYGHQIRFEENEKEKHYTHAYIDDHIILAFEDTAQYTCTIVNIELSINNQYGRSFYSRGKASLLHS